MSIHRILSMMANQPLCAHPATAAMVFNVLMQRAGSGITLPGDGLDYNALAAHQAGMADRAILALPGRTVLRPNSGIDASRFEGEFVESEDKTYWRGREPFLRTTGGVGVISTIGEMVNRGAWVGANSGLTSYEGVNHQFDRAAKDPKTFAIVYDVSSPGGDAVGMDVLAAKIAAVAKIKPVYAVVNGMAASAGYAAISGASEIISIPTGVSGSIGVIMIHMDMTKMAEMKGVEPTLIYAGDHKADGNPLQSLNPDALAELKAGVNTYYQAFVGLVSRHRASRGLTAKLVRDQQARTYIGREAKEQRLVDDLGTFDDVLAAAEKVAKRLGGGRAVRSGASSRGKTMSILNATADNGGHDFATVAGQIQDHPTVRGNPSMLGHCMNLLRASNGAMDAETIVQAAAGMLGTAPQGAMPAGYGPQGHAPQGYAPAFMPATGPGAQPGAMSPVWGAPPPAPYPQPAQGHAPGHQMGPGFYPPGAMPLAPQGHQGAAPGYPQPVHLPPPQAPAGYGAGFVPGYAQPAPQPQGYANGYGQPAPQPGYPQGYAPAPAGYAPPPAPGYGPATHPVGSPGPAAGGVGYDFQARQAGNPANALGGQGQPPVIDAKSHSWDQPVADATSGRNFQKSFKATESAIEKPPGATTQH